MKRSEINKYIREFREELDKISFKVPPFCHIKAEDWKDLGHEYDEIRDRMLGWDVTDFGSGDFFKVGLQLVCMRNGEFGNPNTKTYAEKIMMVRDGQVTPMHFHWNKMEDIINRGGGNLIIKLYNSTDDEKLSDTDVEISVDGVKHAFPAGYELCLKPGDSVTLTPGLYHKFWGEEGKGTIIVQEVSMCNDDANDNRFYEETGRFPEIEEDEAPLYLLCNEYDK